MIFVLQLTSTTDNRLFRNSENMLFVLQFYRSNIIFPVTLNVMQHVVNAFICKLYNIIIRVIKYKRKAKNNTI